MSKVLSPHKQTTPGGSAARVGVSISSSAGSVVDELGGGLDYASNSSFIEFLTKEQACALDSDTDSIFQEVSRLSDSNDMRSVDELLMEAERLIQQQLRLGGLGAGDDTNSVMQHHSESDVGDGGNVNCDGDGESMGNKLPMQTPSPLSQSSSPHSSIKLNMRYARRIEHVSNKTSKSKATPNPAQTPSDANSSFSSNCGFAAFVENLPSESVISEESKPNDMLNHTTATDVSTTTLHLQDNTDDDEDTMEDITEAEVIETLGKPVQTPSHSQLQSHSVHRVTGTAAAAKQQLKQQSLDTLRRCSSGNSVGSTSKASTSTATPAPAPAPAATSNKACADPMQHSEHLVPAVSLGSSTRRNSAGNFMEACPGRRASMHTTLPVTRTRHSPIRSRTPTAGTATTASIATGPIKPMAMFCEKSVGSSPKRMVSTLSSPIEHIGTSITREHALKHEIEQLQEQLKDTEERLESVRVQNDSLSQSQRMLRDHNSRLQEESEMLKLDVQHLNECANVLRVELQAARKDRVEALDMQKSLRIDLEEAQLDRKRANEHKETDARVIQDLQRQCREMERILMRKHPDSVSALIVASKNPGICGLNDQENLNSRKLLEQRIAQLESDAKEQDRKAQQILANVQARFNSVQSKYETHIADLETQVLSLQEINTKLNEQIESQVRTLDRYMQKRAEKYYNNCTQTDSEICVDMGANMSRSLASTGTQTQTTSSCSGGTAMRDHSTNTIGCPAPNVCQQQLLQQQHSASSSTSSTANSTPNNSRPNSKQSGGLRRPGGAAAGTLHVSKLPVSQSDSTLSLLSHGASSAATAGAHGGKEDLQMLSSVRGMRVDLAIKNKAMQRLTRELDDCKKTIRKLQRDRDSSCSGLKSDSKLYNSNAGGARRHDHDHIPATTENQALKEAQNKYRLLEADYKTLHDKRLHDLKTLQSAHERELASCNETVRILQQRLNEREEAFATQKRRKVPVDYYALKAKVSLLERRHSEREERLHMLVEALSKGRLNGALEDLLQENNNK